MLETYFGQPLVVSGNGATKVELEHDHSKLDAYVVKLRFLDEPTVPSTFKCRTEVEETTKS